MRNRATGKSRGFGFVVFEDEKIAAIVAKQVHTLDGRSVSKLFEWILKNSFWNNKNVKI